jgi:transposase
MLHRRPRHNRKNALFPGQGARAGNRAVIAPLIWTGKMNRLAPQAWLTATLGEIVQGHRESQINDLHP